MPGRRRHRRSTSLVPLVRPLVLGMAAPDRHRHSASLVHRATMSVCAAVAMADARSRRRRRLGRSPTPHRLHRRGLGLGDSRMRRRKGVRRSVSTCAARRCTTRRRNCRSAEMRQTAPPVGLRGRQSTEAGASDRGEGPTLPKPGSPSEQGACAVRHHRLWGHPTPDAKFPPRQTLPPASHEQNLGPPLRHSGMQGRQSSVRRLPPPRALQGRGLVRPPRERGSSSPAATGLRQQEHQPSPRLLVLGVSAYRRL